jgi:Raf kinase inhibitor-like YbhB/YbcL family protein
MATVTAFLIFLLLASSRLSRKPYSKPTGSVGQSLTALRLPELTAQRLRLSCVSFPQLLGVRLGSWSSVSSPVSDDDMKHASPHQNSRLAVILFASALIILGGSAAMSMTLSSPAFQHNGLIPSKYTCEGEDVSPPLAWEDVPNGAKSLVLIVDDPDAPDPKAPKMVWVHWVVYNIPPDTKSLPENAGKARLPQGALLGLNDFKKTAYGGPCPPIGRHRYFHKLYALDITLDLRGATKSQIERAMQGHVLANTELIGTYQKGDR